MESPRNLVSQYEWLFWGLIGLMLATGIGNLGALGAPGPTTRWGTILTVKLALVLVFVLGSLFRTLLVLWQQNHLITESILQRAYAATAWSLLLIITIGEVLAHG